MKITKNEIISDKELSNLDNFAIPFASIIEKHTKYVFVSGYVSILLGRSRVSEDVDMLVPSMKENEWAGIYEDLIKHEYFCLNADSAKESYSFLTDQMGVRFAQKGKVVPNMEILFAIKKIQIIAMKTSVLVKVREHKLRISNLELQIAYKEKVLRSPKDMEDAMHLRKLMGISINLQKLNEYEELVKNETI